jgi:hypothetical protein
MAETPETLHRQLKKWMASPSSTEREVMLGKIIDQRIEASVNRLTNIANHYRLKE